MTKLRIIVTGMVGNYPLGGVAWDYFHYLLGLSELGHDVYYHEDTWCWPNHPVLGYPVEDPSYSVQFLRSFFQDHAPHLAGRWHYLHLHEKHFGMDEAAFDEVAKSADLFLNVSGASFFPDNLSPRCVKVFLDTDPGYNQIVMETRPAWSENVDRWIAQVRQHDRHLTYAENIYGADCLLPKVGIDWRPTRCVVTRDPWAALRETTLNGAAPFTTVMSWNYFKGALEYNGARYNAKAEEFEKFMSLPRRVDVPLVVAIGGQKHPARQLEENGWRQIDAAKISLTPQSYIDFIADSAGEWSIAKNCYVAPRTGWFSCRTACYLAAGRPAVVQETGWSRFVPSGEGLFAFETMENVIDAIQEIRRDPARHGKRAHEISREYLSPQKVLPPMIETIFSSDRHVLPPASSPGPVPEAQEGTKR